MMIIDFDGKQYCYLHSAIAKKIFLIESISKTQSISYYNSDMGNLMVIANGWLSTISCCFQLCCWNWNAKINKILFPISRQLLFSHNHHYNVIFELKPGSCFAATDRSECPHWALQLWTYINQHQGTDRICKRQDDRNPCAQKFPCYWNMTDNS